MMSQETITLNLRKINHKFSAILFHNIQLHGKKEGRGITIEDIMKDKKLVALLQETLAAEQKLVKKGNTENLVECLIDMNDLGRIQAKLEFADELRMSI